jgi:hypothetical protein
LIGMNSTFKYISVAGQPGLTAVGLDTLTFVAGTGTQIYTDATSGNQKIRLAVKNPVPSTSTTGILYNDGFNNLSWASPPTYNSITNGTATFSLTTTGNVVFNNGTIQTTAYIPPVVNSDNSTKPLVFVSTNTATQYNSSVGVNPQMGQITLTSIVVGSNITTGPVIGSLGLVTTGTGYVITGTSQATSGGTGVGLTVSFTALQGTLTSAIIANPGIGYSVGDVVSVINTLTTTTATFRVASVNAPGLQGYVRLPDGTQQTTAYTGTVAFGNVTNVPAFITTAIFTTTNISSFVNNRGFINTGTFTTTNVSTFINNAGYLTSSTVNQYVQTTNAAGTFVLGGGLIINNTSTATMILTGTVNGGLIASALNTKPLTVATFNGATTYNWQFNSNGSITWPDGSVQASATTATLAASSLTNNIFIGTWTFSVLSSGTVRYPDGTIQNTAYTGTIFTGVANYSTTASTLLNPTYGTKLRIVPPPSTFVGQTGDMAGDIAYDGTSLYICTANYVQTDFNVTAASTQTNVNFIDIYQAGAPTPDIGWQIRDPIGGPIMTITNVASLLIGPGGQTAIWRLSEATYSNSYFPGLIYVLTNPFGATNVWGKTPLSTAANTSTAVTKLSNFVTVDAPVSLGNISVRWQGPGNTLKIAGVNSSFVGS